MAVSYGGSGDLNTGGISNDNEHSDINTQSILETSDLTDFLERAKLADREFASEKEQFIVLDENAHQVHFDESSVVFDYSECAGQWP